MTNTSVSAGRHRVVVIGAGFGGLAVAKGLRDAPVDLLLIDSNNFHTFQPLLYQVATAGLSIDDIAYPARAIIRRNRSATFRMGTVTAIDVNSRTVTIDGIDVVAYDSLVVAAGAVSDDFGVSGVAEHALPLKSVDDATAIRDRVLRQFERATVDPVAVTEGVLNVVVCGGGPTGVELAGGLAELYRKVLARDAPRVDLTPARIVLVEAADRLLAPFTVASSHDALAALERHGVEVRLGVGVASASPSGVVLADGSEILAPTVVWAAGVRAHPLAAALGVNLDRRGRVVVNADLSVPEHAEVFAIGDIAAAAWGDGVCPQVAQPAIQGGRHVADQILRRLRGEVALPFAYVDKGSMATVGRNVAVAELPNGWRFSGFVGWVAWLGLHLVTLAGMRNRARVLVNWGWNYLTYDRGSRLLAESVRVGERD